MARRAGVSRGALQHHFPGRAELLAAAVRHLAERQLAELEAQFRAATGPSPRLARVLDLLFVQYSGPLFGLVLELTLAARADPDVHAVVAEQEQAINRAITRALRTTLGGALPASHLTLALAAARGTAVLLLLGHPRGAVERRWAATRRDLVELLGDSPPAGQAGRK